MENQHFYPLFDYLIKWDATINFIVAKLRY